MNTLVKIILGLVIAAILISVLYNLVANVLAYVVMGVLVVGGLGLLVRWLAGRQETRERVPLVGKPGRQAEGRAARELKQMQRRIDKQP